MAPTIAIVGRPNVGKSTLFNRLVGRRMALVHDRPGVTRDRRVAKAKLGDFVFTAIDTAGLDEAKKESLLAGMRAQTEAAVAEADLTLFLIDARAGITALDQHFATWLRRRGKKVVLVANKCEGKGTEAALAEAHGLGLGDAVPVSAEHGEGLADLYRAIQERLPFVEEDEAAVEAERPIQLAIVGRPNVGKSTLVNRLVGEERVLTGPEPGITRDAIAIDWSHRGQAVRLVDTAGLRRRAKVTDSVEKLSAGDTAKAIQFADVVVLVVDATEGLDKQDLTIARDVVEEGRALVIALNKWDRIEDGQAVRKTVMDRLEISLAQAKGVAVPTISALAGRHLDRLMDAVLETYERWNRRVATGALNRWLEGAIEAHPPPLLDGRRLKLRYMTQVKTRPPTFALFGGRADRLPESYARYLANGLRKTFDLPGVPIRIVLRKGENPYAPEK